MANQSFVNSNPSSTSLLLEKDYVKQCGEKRDNLGKVQLWVAELHDCDAFFDEGDVALVELRFSTRRNYTRSSTLLKKCNQFFGIDVRNLVEGTSTKTEFLIDSNSDSDTTREHWTGIVFHCKSAREKKRLAKTLSNSIKSRCS